MPDSHVSFRFKAHAAWKLFLLPAIVALLQGCSSQDFGTMAVPLSAHSSGPEVLAASQKSEAEELLRSQRLAKALSQWKNDSGYSRDYHIGVGDTLEFSIMSLEEPGKLGKVLRTVASDGTIDMQWVGPIHVAGLMATETRARVSTELAGRFIKEPQIEVAVSQYRAAPVLITGAVSKPGIYYLTSDRRTILEMLAEADGLAPNAGSELLLIRGGGGGLGGLGDTQQVAAASAVEASSSNAQELVTISLSELIDEGDLRLNLWIKSGDMMTILPKKPSYIYILGYVQRPGAIPISSDKNIGAFQAVAMAGGLTGSSRAQNSCLLRETPAGQKLIPVDLMKIARGQEPNVMLEPGDTLVVGSSLLGRLSEFVRPSVGVGGNYNVIP